MVKYDYTIFCRFFPYAGLNILSMLCWIKWQWYWWNNIYSQFWNACLLDISSIIISLFSSILSLWPASMTPYHDHSWVVVFQSQNRGHRENIICTYMVLKVLRSSPLLVPCYPPTTTPSATYGPPPALTPPAPPPIPNHPVTTTFLRRAPPASTMPPHRGP